MFRRRYKAILVEKDRYFLQFSRYIPRTPIETKPSRVQSLDTYLWSSYPTSINHANAPTWLHRKLIYEMFGHHQKYRGYRTYAKAGLDEDIKKFYDRSHTAAVLGEQASINGVREGKLPEVKDKALVAQVLPGTLSIARINRSVADYYHVKPAVLIKIVKGLKKGLLARKVARCI